MPSLLRRGRLRCFYCNNDSPSEHAAIPTTWVCPHCDATNYLDERGIITDPPEHAVRAAPQLSYASDLAPASSRTAYSEASFCNTCLKNQAIVERIMAEYLPEEDDSAYDKHAASINSYREQVENTYPPVCDNCIERVREQVRRSGNKAKADHVSRILQQSRMNMTMQRLRARRLYWTHKGLVIAQYFYIMDLLVAALWHATGAVVVEGPVHNFSWLRCSKSAYELMLRRTQDIDPACFASSVVVGWARWALVLDLFTLWWNPRIHDMPYRPYGRMRGLRRLWVSRLLAFCLRLWGLYNLVEIPEDSEARHAFQWKHILVLAMTVISAVMTWTSIRIEADPRAAIFSRREEDYLPTIPTPNDAGSQQPYQSARPEFTSFDSMAQSFTTSFNAPGASQEAELPPTPSSIAPSTSDSESETPFRRRSARRFSRADEDSMDWTPTQQDRFGRSRISIEPPIFSKPEPISPSKPPSRSILSAGKPRDDNPFHQKVPSIPRGPEARKHDPWNQSVWNPALQENKSRFLDDIMKQGHSSDIKDRMENGVPRRVKRDAELFQEPKFKYDHTGFVSQKTTGLEDVFNNLFQS